MNSKKILNSNINSIVYIYSIMIWMAGIIVFLLGSVLAAIIYPFDLWLNKSGDLIHIVSRHFASIILFLSRTKIQVEGLENLYKDRAQLICANHQSLFDIFILDSCLPIQFRFVIKKELYSIPILSWCIKKERHILLNRQSKRKGLESIQKASQLIALGRSVLIFPEGTRSKDGYIKEFKKGSLLIATISKAPVVPLIIKGSFFIMSKNSLLVHPSKVRLIICPPIETQYLSRAEEKGLADRVRQVIVEKALVQNHGYKQEDNN